MKYFKKYKDIVVLNYVLLIIYYFFFNSINLDIEGGIMFTTYDSTTYFKTSNEFYKFSETGFSNIRPFLFPLILLIAYKTIGVTGLWLMQVLFWLVSVNLLYFSIKKSTNNIFLPYLGALVMATNFSLLGLTMQCLTEVTTVLLISIFLYNIVVHIANISSLAFFHRMLIVLVLLTVTKPVFFIPLLILLFVIFPVFYLKQYLHTPRKLLFLFVLLMPLFFQLTLMKVKYNVFTISQISSETFRNYLFAQGIQQNDNSSIADAREKALAFTQEEVNNYLLENKALYASIYFQNLKNTIDGYSSFLLGPRGFIYTGWGKYMAIVNSIYYYLHLLFVLPLLALLYYLFKQKSEQFFFLLSIPILLVYYVFFTSPVSFNEGDRLVITTLPLWIFVYVLVANIGFNLFIEKKKS